MSPPMENCASNSVYKRITLVLIVCTIAVFCFNQGVSRMTYEMQNTKWPDLFGNASNGHSVEKAYNPAMFIHKTQTSNNLQKSKNKKFSSLTYIPKDLMSIGPFNFLKNYKNPCWVPATRHKKEPAVLCLPYFYLIGAPKSGTTDLHRRLIQHPDISNLVQKETHWLTRRRFESIKQSTFADYLKYFSDATREISMNSNASSYHSKIFGDCSASTMFDNDYWTVLPEFRNLLEPKYTNADYIHHLNPNTKIIAILRNPVNRLYSDYLYFLHGSPEMFHKGVVNIINETHECLKSYSLRHCLYIPQPSIHDTNGKSIKVRLRIGIYHLHLKEYLRVFPREQLMVIKLEEFSKTTTTYMQKIFAFLELRDLRNKDLQRTANPEKHANPRREKDRATGPMLPETREMLEKFYSPHNALLADLFGEQFNYNTDNTS